MGLSFGYGGIWTDIPSPPRPKHNDRVFDWNYADSPMYGDSELFPWMKGGNYLC